jgi:hypothetical protein
VAGCGQDFVGKISCSTNAECLSAAAGLFDDASPASALPMCCGGICVLPAGGCEPQPSDNIGYRYLTNDPGYGNCVSADPMCPIAPEPPDLSVPVVQDLSSSD